jgi:hypothetical protein
LETKSICEISLVGNEIVGVVEFGCQCIQTVKKMKKAKILKGRKNHG